MAKITDAEKAVTWIIAKFGALYRLQTYTHYAVRSAYVDGLRAGRREKHKKEKRDG